MPAALRPFPDGSTARPQRVEARLRREGASVELAWFLEGDLDAIVIPAPADIPARRDELWQSTCVEAFLAPAGGSGYLEVNVSPSGDWNVYRFIRYREGQRPVEPEPLSPVATRRDGDRLVITATLRLPDDLADLPLDAGATAVIVGNEPASAAGPVPGPTPAAVAKPTYWALSHVGERPDFHLRGSLTLRL